MSNARITPDIKGQDGACLASTRLRASRLLAPELKTSSPMPPMRLNRVLDFVDANIALDLCVSTLAGVAGMSPYYFCRVFKQSTGLTPHRYVLHRRMEQAKHLMEQKPAHLLDIAQAVGFSDQSQFARVFRKMVGTTPSHYRKTQWVRLSH